MAKYIVQETEKRRRLIMVENRRERGLTRNAQASSWLYEKQRFHRLQQKARSGNLSIVSPTKAQCMNSTSHITDPRLHSPLNWPNTSPTTMRSGKTSFGISISAVLDSSRRITSGRSDCGTWWAVVAIMMQKQDWWHWSKSEGPNRSMPCFDSLYIWPPGTNDLMIL